MLVLSSAKYKPIGFNSILICRHVLKFVPDVCVCLKYDSGGHLLSLMVFRKCANLIIESMPKYHGCLDEYRPTIHQPM